MGTGYHSRRLPFFLIRPVALGQLEAGYGLSLHPADLGVCGECARFLQHWDRFVDENHTWNEQP